MTKRTWMEIDLDVLCENYRQILKKLPGQSQVMAVVKADAYGVGAVPVALALQEEGCTYFAVTFFEEAVALREAGITQQILAMAPIDQTQVAQAAALDVTLTIAQEEDGALLMEQAKALGVEVNAHIKLDTGLSRLGFLVDGHQKEVVETCKKLFALDNVNITGIYTHVTSASQSLPGGNELNLAQLQRYCAVCDDLLAQGYTFIRHCLSTGPTVEYPDYVFDYARLGSIIYGFYGSATGDYGDYAVENCVYLKSKVISVKTIAAGTSVSYGPLFTALRDTRLAVVPIGFSDGLRRALSNKAHMLIRGQKAPIVGKICCDHTILDVTDIPDVALGDLVTMFGTDGAHTQTVGTYARMVGATAAETTAVLHHRIPRIPVRKAETK